MRSAHTCSINGIFSSSDTYIRTLCRHYVEHSCYRSNFSLSWSIRLNQNRISEKLNSTRFSPSSISRHSISFLFRWNRFRVTCQRFPGLASLINRLLSGLRREKRITQTIHHCAFPSAHHRSASRVHIKTLLSL